jgi:hypothetical protein
VTMLTFARPERLTSLTFEVYVARAARGRRTSCGYSDQAHAPTSRAEVWEARPRCPRRPGGRARQ